MKNAISARDVKKIAVLRANAVGDYIMALPALEALRSAFPEAEMVLLGRHWHADFLRGRPGPVNRTVVVPYTPGIYDPPGDGVGNPGELKSFFEAMARERFDLAFQLHGGGRNSNPFVRSLGARETIGTRTPDAVPLDRWTPYRVHQHETLRLLEIVSLAGAGLQKLQPHLRVTDADRAEADRVVPDDGRPVVVINPGSRDPRRRWPARKFAVVADLLARMGAHIVINGDAGDADAVRETEYWMHSSHQTVRGVLSLSGLAGLLSRTRLLLTNDSGPLHLAAAVGTPTVGIYWCGNVLTYGPLQCRTTAVHIAWRFHCPVCGEHCMQPGCRHQDSFVADVPAEEVMASATELYRQEDRAS